jgi:site-specific DNA recombinase
LAGCGHAAPELVQDGLANFNLFLIGDKRLIRDIIQARQWFADLVAGRAGGIADLARRSACNASHVSRRITLAVLAPDIVEMILSGTQPIDLTPERLKQACPLSVSWGEQRAQLLA